ncbi:carbohydrate kinase family protein [Limibaculum sp. FT325]|uniref:carbohydrate kinase family protein n=1 Tax=Thermohalobaculum sediminis TaxID=2939436 RepID=UPI0020BE6917|nr:carbohydrate kinase family protein [Limibaculum sediminis]MCL5777992.1 carbohydrate kinase family protein [Limibaculum sediminis]
MKSLHIGSATIDIICIVAAENIERMTMTNEGKSFLMVESGRKVPAESISDHVGGGACNTAVSLARRGWRVAVLARVGDDLNGEAVREHLARYGVAADRLITDSDAPTGTSVMIASHDRNASIFVQRGANERLTMDDIPNAVLAGHDLVYVGPLSSGSADCFPAIVAAAKRSGALVISNPGIRQLTSRTAAFVKALGDVDLLSVNRVEAEALVPAFAARSEGPDPVPGPDAPALLRRGLSFGGFEMGLLRFLHEVREVGPRWVCLTDGTDGAWLAAPEGVFWRASAPAEVAGTAGAGDSYTSTLAAALAEGLAPEDAMLEAAINAASVVSVVDTTSGLMDRDALATARARFADLPLFRA